MRLGHVLERAAQGRERAARRARGGDLTQGLRLEQEAQRVDVLDVAIGERGHGEAAPVGYQQAVARQPGEP